MITDNFEISAKELIDEKKLNQKQVKRKTRMPPVSKVLNLATAPRLCTQFCDSASVQIF